ncbi:unnamed protein product [Staurois parvus]|uniref:Uncharacterized protein n=1 Tax=Staurois parvus TaxID=386267 RepID=A0ABN9CFK0_9NEOB|nr:unnamed protein product [Staurois parvus]
MVVPAPSACSSALRARDTVAPPGGPAPAAPPEGPRPCPLHLGVRRPHAPPEGPRPVASLRLGDPAPAPFIENSTSHRLGC